MSFDEEESGLSFKDSFTEMKLQKFVTIGSFKGTVARDFLARFFSWIYFKWDQISRLKGFSFLFGFAKLFKYFDESAL
jgi:hypothetical protein